jgi:endonuclease-8
VCFLLGASPWAPVGGVDAAEAVRLSRELLARNAERPEQSTTGTLGRNAQHWVFERGGRPCRRCGTTVRTATQAPPEDPVHERITYYCPTCQPGPHPSRPC